MITEAADDPPPGPGSAFFAPRSSRACEPPPGGAERAQSRNTFHSRAPQGRFSVSTGLPGGLRLDGAACGPEPMQLSGDGQSPVRLGVGLESDPAELPGGARAAAPSRRRASPTRIMMIDRLSPAAAASMTRMFFIMIMPVAARRSEFRVQCGQQPASDKAVGCQWPASSEQPLRSILEPWHSVPASQSRVRPGGPPPI